MPKTSHIEPMSTAPLDGSWIYAFSDGELHKVRHVNGLWLRDVWVNTPAPNYEGWTGEVIPYIERQAHLDIEMELKAILDNEDEDIRLGYDGHRWAISKINHLPYEPPEIKEMAASRNGLAELIKLVSIVGDVEQGGGRK